jgi:hypothetical protein
MAFAPGIPWRMPGALFLDNYPELSMRLLLSEPLEELA